MRDFPPKWVTGHAPVNNPPTLAFVRSSHETHWFIKNKPASKKCLGLRGADLEEGGVTRWRACEREEILRFNVTKYIPHMSENVMMKLILYNWYLLIKTLNKQVHNVLKERLKQTGGKNMTFLHKVK